MTNRSKKKETVDFQYESEMRPFISEVLKTLVSEPGYDGLGGHGIQTHGGHGRHKQCSIGLDGRTLNFRESVGRAPVIKMLEDEKASAFARIRERTQFSNLHDTLNNGRAGANKRSWAADPLGAGNGESSAYRQTDYSNSKHLWPVTKVTPVRETFGCGAGMRVGPSITACGAGMSAGPQIRCW